MPEQYDVFNGDADGIIALHQLRLAAPKPGAELISGVKRDIRLLDKLNGVSGAEITVLDISLDVNRQPLLQLLKSNRVQYIDHHFAGDLPVSQNFSGHINPDPNVCTSLIVDKLLTGAHRPWAVAAAFGDNLHDSAQAAAQVLQLMPEKLENLREIGELLNYNGYGKKVGDLYFSPQEMYTALQPYADPFAFFAQSPELNVLRDGFVTDMNKARQTAPVNKEGGVGRVYKLPAESWSRRVAGVFSNEVARQEKDMAHAILVDNDDATFTVSVRAPLNNKKGADNLCRAFPTGGGRAAAGGINALPAESLAIFLQKFEEVFSL